MIKKFGIALSIALFSFCLQSQVRAQSTSFAFLSFPDTRNFPTISAFLDVRDSEGNLIPDLTADRILILEDGNQLPASGISVSENGMQYVLAINTATSFAIVDQLGMKRYDYISDSLKLWAESVIDTSGDDLSITTSSGVRTLHQSDYGDWLSDFESFQPSFQTAVPSLTSLERAIDIAAETSTVRGASRVVLWLTPSLDQSYNADLLSLEQQARLAGVRVFVWMIDSQAYFKAEQAYTLQAFASQTGGKFFAFSGIEPFPDLDSLLNDTRAMYQISYQSQITSAGSHDLAVTVQLESSLVSTSSKNFDMVLQPPTASLSDAPTQITRSLNDASEGLSELAPKEYEFEIAIEFPDNLPRNISRTSLLVNGNIVSETLTAPFETLSLDLSQYIESDQLDISVQVEDELGIVGSSPVYPIQIRVEGVPQGFQALFARFGSLLVVSMVLVAAAILLLVILLAGRLQPKPRGARKSTRPRYEDPVTQPITRPIQSEAKTEPSRIFKQVAKIISRPRLPKISKPADSEHDAYLLPFVDNNNADEVEKISLPEYEISLGSDEDQSFVPIHDPGVEPLHARLWRDKEGHYHLADENSVAGTWVNYAPISQTGSVIEHGDLIHIGKAGFRFGLHNPPAAKKPLIIQDKSKSIP